MEKIRILHVVTYMGRGGLENMIMNYYRHVDRDKVQFDFLVHREFRADFDDEIESLGGKIYRLPKLVPWSITYRKALDSFFKEHTEYKIVHVHLNCLSSVILKVANKYGVPVRIAHSHSTNQSKNLKYFIKMYYKMFIPRYSTDLFACSKSAGEWMFRGSSFLLLNNAIKASDFTYDANIRNTMRENFGITNETFVIGHVGSIYKPKNHTFLIDVFAEICKREEKAFLLLVGNGGLKKEIEYKVSKLGLTNRVIFAGIRSDIKDIYQVFDVFVFPSLYEGLGVAAIEAQAAGLPCFVSERVPDECKVTDLVTKLKLSDGASKWACEILNHRRHNRENTYNSIVEVGYDIVSNAKWLQNYYLEKWNEEV